MNPTNKNIKFPVPSNADLSTKMFINVHQPEEMFVNNGSGYYRETNQYKVLRVLCRGKNNT